MRAGKTKTKWIKKGKKEMGVMSQVNRGKLQAKKENKM